MIISVIDLGTVSVRFDIYKIAKNSPLEIVSREKVMQRLGHDLFSQGSITQAAIERTILAFKEHLKICERHSVEKIIAVGTSALRVAPNSGEFVEKLFEETGIKLKIISGEEEARLIAKGIIANEKICEPCAFVDIGGGSTEISIYRDSEIVFAKSFELGASRLQEVFLKKSPPDGKDISALCNYSRTALQDLSPYRVPRIIGSSGTIRSLVKIANDNDNNAKSAPQEALESLIAKMIPLSRAELLAIPGLEENRVDIILAGSLLFREIMNILDCEVIEKTHFSLRHGLAQEEIEKL